MILQNANGLWLLGTAKRRLREGRSCAIVLNAGNREVFVNMDSIAKYDENYIYLKPAFARKGRRMKIYPTSCISRLESC